MALPCIIPRGFFAAFVPWQWLLAMRRLLLCACAQLASFDWLLFCPVGFVLPLVVPPSQMLRDINDSRWPAWVAVVVVIIELWCCL